ncbi:MAG: hypothetical protein HUU54_04215 [Ignavibacteriaceae bacterium]|nr:hypothetical protein [Ignavibacteriaceae bacterium]
MIKKIFIAILLLVVTTPAQESAQGNAQSGVFGSVTIIYSDDSFSMTDGNSTIAGITITGKKVVIFSSEKSMAVLINYGFTKNKENYPITYYLLEQVKGVAYKGEITGYYDMPHPLFTVNESGVIAYCDPGTLKLTTDNYGNSSDVKLFGSIEYEMERGIFLQSDEERVYIAGNLKPAALELQEDNVFVAAVRISNLSIEKKMLPFLAVKSFEISNDRVILDAYHFRAGYTEKRISTDKELKVIE